MVDRICHELSRMAMAAQPGKSLLPPEHELTTRLGVSRTVLREATKRLESQGLLESRHGVGVEVIRKLHKPVSYSLRILVPDLAESLRQAMEVRILLEIETARRAAEHASAETIAELRRIHEMFERSTQVEEAAHLDVAFHQVIAESSGNALVGLMLDSISELGTEVRKLTLSRAGIPFGAMQHRAILEAIEQCNPEAAAAAMQVHLAHASQDLEAQLAASPATPTPKRRGSKE